MADARFTLVSHTTARFISMLFFVPAFVTDVRAEREPIRARPRRPGSRLQRDCGGLNWGVGRGDEEWRRRLWRHETGERRWAGSTASSKWMKAPLG
jgi:hypothetical protein